MIRDLAGELERFRAHEKQKSDEYDRYIAEHPDMSSSSIHMMEDALDNHFGTPNLDFQEVRGLIEAFGTTALSFLAEVAERDGDVGSMLRELIAKGERKSMRKVGVSDRFRVAEYSLMAGGRRRAAIAASPPGATTSSLYTPQSAAHRPLAGGSRWAQRVAPNFDSAEAHFQWRMRASAGVVWRRPGPVNP